MHGFDASSEQFYFTGWVAALRDRYQLISIDSRGHGMSDKPHESEAYRMELSVSDVTAVLDDLGIPQAHYLGFSIGGRIGWGIAKYAPERVTSLIIGGIGAEDPDPNHPDAWSQEMIGLLRRGQGAVVAAVRERAVREIRVSQKPSVLETILSQRLQLISKCDPEALVASLLCWQKECLRISEILPSLTIPCLVFVSEADYNFKAAKAASELIPHAQFVSFPGLAHIETLARLDLVLPSVLGFLAKVDSRPKVG